MDKLFTTINEQVAILESRGMVILNKQEVLSILEKNNYYCIVNGYKNPFLDKTSNTEKYISSTRFSEIYSLYNFDKDISNLFLKYILKVENIVKSIIAHEFSRLYGHDNYLKADNFNHKIDKTKVIDLLSRNTNTNSNTT